MVGECVNVAVGNNVVVIACPQELVESLSSQVGATGKIARLDAAKLLNIGWCCQLQLLGLITQ